MSTSRFTLLVASLMVPAIVAATACGGGAAPPPTTAPAAPAATKPAATAAPAATTAPVATKPAATTGDVAAGKAVFEQNCNACHPNGNAGVGPSLVGRNLTASQITNVVRNGRESMPAFSTSQISDAQLANLIAYVQSLK